MIISSGVWIFGQNSQPLTIRRPFEMEDEVRIEEGPLGLRTRTTVGSLMFIKLFDYFDSLSTTR